VERADLTETYKNIDQGKLAKGAAGSIALEGIGLAFGPAGKLVRGALGKAASESLPKAGTGGAFSLFDFAKSAGKVGVGAATEGATEYGQTFIESVGAGDFDAPDLQTALQSPRIQDDAAKAFAGATVGSIIPGAGFRALESRYGQDSAPMGDDTLTPEERYSKAGLTPYDPEAAINQPPAPTAEDIAQQEVADREARRLMALDRVGRIEVLAPTAFDTKPAKKVDQTATVDPAAPSAEASPLSYKEFSKLAEQSWAATVPMLSDADIDAAFVEAVQADPTVDYKAFSRDMRKQVAAEHEQNIPKPTTTDINTAFADYLDLHRLGVRSFGDARSAFGGEPLMGEAQDTQGPVTDAAPGNIIQSPVFDISTDPTALSEAEKNRQFDEMERQRQLQLAQQPERLLPEDVTIRIGNQGSRGFRPAPSTVDSAEREIIRDLGNQQADTAATTNLGTLLGPAIERTGFTPTVDVPSLVMDTATEFNIPATQVWLRNIKTSADVPAALARTQKAKIEEPARAQRVAMLNSLQEKLGGQNSTGSATETGRGNASGQTPQADIFTAPVAGATQVKPGGQAKAQAAPVKKNRWGVNPENDDLITAVRKLGGIDTDLEIDFDGRLSHLQTQRVVGVANIERPGKGRSLDDLAQDLWGLGYLQAHDAGELYSKLWNAESGNQSFSDGKQDYGQEKADNGTDRWIEQVERASSEDEVAEIMRAAGEDSRFQARFRNDADFQKAWYDAVDYADSVFAPTPRQTAPTPAPTEDLLPAANTNDRQNADRLALEERQRETQRRLNATQAPQGGGLFDMDNRQDEMDIFSDVGNSSSSANPGAATAIADKTTDISTQTSRFNLTSELPQIPTERSEAQRTVDETTLPDGVRVEVVDGLPRSNGQHTKARISTNPDGSITVQIAAKAHKSGRDIRRTMRHEIIGHYGLSLLDRDARSELLDRITNSTRVPSLVRAAAYVKQRYGDLNPADQAEEIFSRIAETEPGMLARALEAVEDLIIRGLKKLGIVPKHVVAKKELREIISEIEDSIRRNAGQQSKVTTADRRARGTAPWISQAVQAAKDAGIDAKDFATRVGRFMLNPRQMADWNPELPAVGQYADVFERMSTEIGAGQHEIGQIVDKLLAMKPGDQRRLLQAMTDATLLGVHPDLGFDESMDATSREGVKRTLSNKHLARDDRQAEYDYVRKQFEALPARSQKLFLDTRNFFADAWANRIKEVEKLIEDEVTSPGSRRKLSEDLKRLWRQVEGPYFPLMRDGRFAVVWKSPQYLAAEQAGDRKAMDALKQVRKDQPVHYWVDFTDSKAEAIRNSETTPEGMAEGSSGKWAERDQVKTETSNSSSFEFLSRLEDAIRREAKDTDLSPKEAEAMVKAQMDTVSEALLATMPEMSVMKRTLGRKRVAGARPEMMLRGIAKAGSSDAYYIAKLRWGAPLRRALASVREQDTTRQVFNSLAQHYDWVSAPLPGGPVQAINTAAGMLTSASYLFGLGLNGAYLVSNMLQAPMVSGPLIAGNLGGGLDQHLKAEKALTTALVDAARIVPPSLTNYTLRTEKAKTAGERAMLDELLAEGRIEISQSRDLMSIAQGYGPASKLVEGVTKIATLGAAGSPSTANFLARSLGSFAHYTETANRVATAMAAYRLHYAKHKDQDAAVRFASKMTSQSQGDFSPAGKPTFMQNPNLGGVARLAMQYKRYSISMASLWAMQAAKAGLLNDRAVSTEERRAARSALKGMVAWQVMLGAGVIGGLPTNSLFELGNAVVNALDFGDDDEDLILEQRIADWAKALSDAQFDGSDAARKTFEGFLAKGLMTELLDFDLGQKVGHGEVLDLFGMKRLAEKLDRGEKPGGAVVDSVLPAMGFVNRVWGGMDEISHGRLGAGLVKLMPTTVSGQALAGYRLGQQGMLNKRKTQVVIKPEEFSDSAIAGEMMGFTSLRREKYFDDRSRQIAKTKDQKQPRTDLLDQWVNSQRFSRTADRVNKVRERISEFNQANPKNKITQRDLSDALKRAKGYEKKLVGGLPTTKANRAEVKEMVR